MSDYSLYPKALDGYAQLPLAVDKRSPINAESVNRLRSAIISVEAALGVMPQGEHYDVSNRLSSLDEAKDDLLLKIEQLSVAAEALEDDLNIALAAASAAESIASAAEAIASAAEASLVVEVAERVGADSALSEAIIILSEELIAADALLEAAISSEAAARSTADTA